MGSKREAEHKENGNELKIVEQVARKTKKRLVLLRNKRNISLVISFRCWSLTVLLSLAHTCSPFRCLSSCNGENELKMLKLNEKGGPES